MDRKEFIKTCGLACLCGTAVGMLLDSCASINHYAQATVTDNLATVKKTEFTKMVKGKATELRYVIVKTEKLAFPIYLRHQDGVYTALLMKCTHQGCELQAHGSFLVCPCHGSEFTDDGTVQNPPADQNLLSYKTSTDNESIYIHL